MPKGYFFALLKITTLIQLQNSFESTYTAISRWPAKIITSLFHKDVLNYIFTPNITDTQVLYMKHDKECLIIKKHIQVNNMHLSH